MKFMNFHQRWVPVFGMQCDRHCIYCASCQWTT